MHRIHFFAAHCPPSKYCDLRSCRLVSVLRVRHQKTGESTIEDRRSGYRTVASFDHAPWSQIAFQCKKCTKVIIVKRKIIQGWEGEYNADERGTVLFLDYLSLSWHGE